MTPEKLLWSGLSRRGFIATATALGALTGKAATPTCTLTSEQEEGPYYVESAMLRRDLKEDKPGLPLTLRIALVNSKTCEPIRNAAMDIWHCDATGVYSGFTSASPDGGGGPGGPGFGGPGPGGPGRRGPRTIDPTRFLRGVQISDNKGLTEFATLYPGWYSGRAIHVHMKVHLGGDRVVHTGQIFFPEDITERVARLQPYATRLSVHRTTQEEDMVFRPQHGESSMAQLERIKSGADTEGFIASVTLAVDPDATPQPVGGGGGRGRGRGPGGPPPARQ